MIRMPTDGVEKDYIKIAYAGSDCLYVPATALDLVSKYIGAGEDTEHTRLNKLGGTGGPRPPTGQGSRQGSGGGPHQALRPAPARRATPSPGLPVAAGIRGRLRLHGNRRSITGHPGDQGGYGKARPMDRLLCGDVGYGKTEVALRAVMKCILDGKQAAILVPPRCWPSSTMPPP